MTFFTQEITALQQWPFTEDDAHRIQPFYAHLLAQACGLTAGVALEGDVVVVTASP